MRSKSCVFIIVVVACSTAFNIPCFSSDAPFITPAPKGLTWKNFSVELGSDWKILITNSNGISAIAEYLRDGLSDKTGVFLGTQRSPATRFGRSVMLFLATEKLPDAVKAKGFSFPGKLGKEGYVLEIFDDCILIVAEAPAGIFYGVGTLLQMIDVKDGKTTVPAAKITDFPNVKVRGVHILDPDPDRLKSMIDAMAKLKMNFFIISTWKLFDLDKGDNSQKFQEAFAYARRLFMEPVPELAGFGQGGPILTKEPYAAEGIWVEDELYRFRGNKAEPLLGSKSDLRNLIRTGESNVTITDAAKSRIYKEGIDYEIINGETIYPFPPSVRPAEIARIPSGSIGDMQQVLISYDYAENKCAKWAPWSVPFCPSSELTYKVMFKSLEGVISLLQPRYISIANDEIRGMNRDSRCRKRNMTNAELLSDEISRLDDFVRSASPETRLMMWDDMLNPWHNGGDEKYQVQFGGPPGKTSKATGLIPKDVIMMVWWYDADDWLSKMKNSPDYFESNGFDYIGAAYKDRKNIKDWGELINKKPKCMGLITTAWDGWDKNLDGIKYIAEEAW